MIERSRETAPSKPRKGAVAKAKAASLSRAGRVGMASASFAGRPVEDRFKPSSALPEGSYLAFDPPGAGG